MEKTFEGDTMSSNRLGYLRLYQHLDKIFLLFFTSFLTLDYVWRPINSWLSVQLLQHSGFQFLSYNNIIAILTSRPWIGAGLLLLFVVNLFVAYFQIVYLFKGLYNLFDEERLSLQAFIRKTWRDTVGAVGQFSLSKVVFISFYIIVLFPILGKLLNIYYLNKILVPTFIMDYLANNLWVGVIILLLALGVLILSIRWLFALPQILFAGASVKEALTYSREKTAKNWWRYFGRMILLTIKTTIFYQVTVLLVLLLQALADSQADSSNPQLLFVAAIINFSLIKLAYYMMVSYFLLKFMGMVTEQNLPVGSAKQHPLLRLVIVGIAAVFFALEGSVTLLKPWEAKPLVISHRGVSNANGVQNTIESLEATAKLQPDYVEMDIQETADGQFVLMHDPNLRVLAGIDATTHDLTLAELIQIDVSENGHTAKIPSFEAYLDKADELGQKLLIELKTSNQDSSDMMNRFLATYGKRIKDKGHQIQSLDYHVVDATVAYDKDIPVYFILPYNTIFPQTQATGYTMEYSTLDDYFTGRVWAAGKQVYDWTINDEEAIRKSFQLDVDGMITDDVELVQENINDEFDNPDFFELLWNYATDYVNIFASAA